MTEQVPIRVAIIDDDAYFSVREKRHLEQLGCVVVAIARTMAEATNLVQKLDSEQVKYVLLGDSTQDQDSQGINGREIAAQISKLAPLTETIGFSTPNQDYVTHAFGKYGSSIEDLKAIIYPVSEAKRS